MDNVKEIAKTGTEANQQLAQTYLLVKEIEGNAVEQHCETLRQGAIGEIGARVTHTTLNTPGAIAIYRAEQAAIVQANRPLTATEQVGDFAKQIVGIEEEAEPLNSTQGVIARMFPDAMGNYASAPALRDTHVPQLPPPPPMALLPPAPTPQPAPIQPQADPHVESQLKEAENYIRALESQQRSPAPAPPRHEDSHEDEGWGIMDYVTLTCIAFLATTAIAYLFPGSFAKFGQLFQGVITEGDRQEVVIPEETPSPATAPDGPIIVTPLPADS